MTPKLTRPVLSIAVLGAALMLAACEPPSEPYEPEAADARPIEIEPAPAPAAEDAAAPTGAEAPTDTPAVEALPPETRSSEESVQPDSETLFY